MSPIAWRPRIVAFILVALALALAAATTADAAIITAQDGQGRTITYDVRATAVDTDWYTAVLRASAHGDEISRLTIRIVPEPDIEAICGGAAAACYTGRRGEPRIIISAGKSAGLASTLLHEYGHHLDNAWRVPGVPELNGTPVWWNARGMAALLSQRRVAFDYSLGWDNSVGEIFAEDYAYIHTGSRYAITWLRPPDDALKSAMFAELGSPQAALPDSPETPLILNRRGTLVPRDRYSVPFGLLGPGRHVTLTATLSKPTRKGIRARAQIVCDGRVVASQPFGKGRSKRVLDLPNLGPASCDARLISSTGVSLAYRLKLRLAVENV
ncbi:hypothetical protein BH18ACT12_BH18ACT12_14210 [soil metagenome]